MEYGFAPAPERVPKATGQQHRAFLCVRDEADRLPFLLSYYRRLGINWFFIVDNGSTDGTATFVREQPDCSLFVTHESFSAARQGTAWINALMERFGEGHWCLYVDADELFVYPHSETVQLPTLCSYLAAQQYEGIYAFMLDMYSACPISAARYEIGTSFLDVCPLHDADYRFRARPYVPFCKAPFPPFEVVGGPRLRHFYPEFLDAGTLGYYLPRALTKLRRSKIGQALGLPRIIPRFASPPLLSKVPLVFGRHGRRHVSNHATVPLRLAPLTGALLHFKFFSDFHNRVVTGVERREYFDESSEYGRYSAALAAKPEVSFAGLSSIRYKSTRNLVDLRLLRTDPRYEDFVATKVSQRPRQCGRQATPA
jgi:Glycosyl transferase family 2